MTDVVLVHPDASALYQNLADHAAVETPIWAALLADYLREGLLSVAIVDQEAERLSPLDLSTKVAALDPLLVAIVVYGHHPSASTQVMPAARVAAREIRALCPRTRIAFVGGHAAALPVRTCCEEPTDFVVSGEGFVALHELALALKERRDPTRGPGLVYRHSSGNSFASLGGPAGNLPSAELSCLKPAYDLLPMDRYRAHNWHALGGLPRSPYASLYTTLGCPYDCSFCCIQAPFREGENLFQGRLPMTVSYEANSYRQVSPEWIGKTLVLLREKYGVRNVKIADEMFVLNKRHVIGICSEIHARGLGDLNLWAYGRVDTIPVGLEKILFGAGFRWLALGIEAASDAVRGGAGKRFSLQQTREAVDRVRQAGIHVIANYVFGLPGETADSMVATLDFATELNTEFANFYCATAYPGSALYDQVDKGQLPASWSGYHQHAPDFRPLSTEQLHWSDILAFRDRAFVRYHGSERYLGMIETTFGKIGRGEIAGMLGETLRRSA